MTITSAQTAGKPCVYCALPEIREREVLGNGLAWSFPTNIPITDGHTLIAPRACKASMRDLSNEERLAILDLADQLMALLRSMGKAEGFNCVWNEGKLAGQSVPHFHLHIIPRKEGDTGLLGYDPRSLLYRTGDREPSTEEEMLKVRDSMRNALYELPAT